MPSGKAIQTVFLMAAGVALVGSLAVALVIIQKRYVDASKAEIEAAVTELETLRQVGAGLAELEQHHDKVVRARQELRDRLRATRTPAEVLQEISESLLRQSLRLNTLQPLEEKTEPSLSGTQVTRLAFHVSLEGPYAKVGAWLESLRRLSLPVVVESLRVARGTSHPPDLGVELHGTILFSSAPQRTEAASQTADEEPSDGEF